MQGKTAAKRANIDDICAAMKKYTDMSDKEIEDFI